ncbi:enoyl-CoA hydratase/isomerase family protein [Bradyrhizobium sp. BRP20]|uniref:enoyl-CoA hydratase/isomerase family protein n=1 Tax=unclassified Bradyrhizobium TaxID=2631580 RepID=UPI001CD5DEF3|nr:MULTISPECIES: enoyl-CoA hydratase/isomerase family protein [unclassified Bradyrhizobium]MCA1437249.1 enoyl-CoA hydratase/isomerase family protein [Bradyrhizobium sp. BRP20]MCA1472555.1 enoyl-CoA hydratase/isomerase family protein [Bradyrhizobium sp. IC3195]MCA1551334.1 enoyl-CoA hydratase/isomerase family protein [Bradyrhizobium sp. BRP19]
MSIDFELRNSIAIITINRPTRMNALDRSHYSELSSAWTQVRDDRNIRAAIITGAGCKAFCAGADLKDEIPNPPGPAEMWRTQREPLLNRGLEIWKPVVAAVNGWCLGGGMTLLLATDIRVAAEHAQFGVPEVKRGIIAGNGGTQRLLAQLPYPIAMQMLLAGDSIGAAVAERWGLVNLVVPADQVFQKAWEQAERLARNPPLAVQASKELSLRGRDVDLATGLRLEQMFNRFLMTTADAAEGARAFVEKREATFIGS